LTGSTPERTDGASASARSGGGAARAVGRPPRGRACRGPRADYIRDVAVQTPQRSTASLAAFAAAAALLAGAGALSARDDFLRATSRDLNPRERQALDERIAELGHPDPAKRNQAIDLLVAIGRPAVPALVETVRMRRGRDPKLLRNACLALGALGDVTSLALLERWFLEETPPEEPSRATLLALARGRGAPSQELSERLRKLMVDAPIATVRECALLCAGFRKVAGLPEILRGPLQSERVARVRGCMLVALGECGDPAAAALVAPFLDGRKVRDEKLRRAALYAVARLAEPALLAPLLRFEPDHHEVAAFAVALGAYADPAAVNRLGALLQRERERAAVAVFSLANGVSPEAKEWLSRAIAGEFSDRVGAAAALAVADLTDQQRFLPRLRELATARLGEPGKSPALLTLARMGDVEAAATIAEALPLWRDPELLERGLLLCATTLGDRRAEELLPRERSGAVRPLWREIEGIRAGRVDGRLLAERIAAALTAARAHWTLARDDLRMAVLDELLELDKVVFVDPRDPGSGGGETPPPGGGGPPPPDGSGGGAPPPPSGGAGGVDGGPPRRGKQDTARIELDLRPWLIDYPPFELARPFSP